jgi:hypothetical protein
MDTNVSFIYNSLAMFSKKEYLIVAISTFHNDLLRLSVPALKNIHLVIHNVNPDTIITRQSIRRLGYCGPLHIINDGAADILSEIATLKIKSEWMVFVNEGDMLVNAEIPIVAHNNYAIIQNAILLKRGEEKNHVLRPNAEFYGTLFRTGFILKNRMENSIMSDANPIYMDRTNYIKVEL